MKTEEIIGEWFLPDSDFRLSGQLRVDHKKRKIELVLYGTRYIENKEIKIGG